MIPGQIQIVDSWRAVWIHADKLIDLRETRKLNIVTQTGTEARVMELATTLTSQTVQNAVREVGINANYWYAVGWASELKPGEITPVIVWQQAIAVYRDTNGQIHALEDVCPHRGVALHKGKVQGCHLACAYHGWEFNGSGQCVSIPYLPQGQKLPRAQARSYPVQEKYNLIWIFPGDPSLAATCQPPDIPEFDQPDLLMVPITAQIKAHFSMCNDNSMDVFHGFLHQKLQGWFDPVLISLRETGGAAVCAEYKVSYKGRMAQFLGLSERADQVTTLPVSTEYRYPHFYSSLQGVSSLYLMRLPVGPTETRSFALFFFKVRLPRFILRPLKPLLQKLLQSFLLKFLAQDIEMVESEQQTYLANPHRHYVEINPAIIAIQRLTVRQYEQFMQKSSQPQTTYGNRDLENSISLSEAMPKGGKRFAQASRQAELTKENPNG